MDQIFAVTLIFIPARVLSHSTIFRAWNGRNKDHISAINELDKEIKTLQRKQAELLKTHSELSAARERYDQLFSDFEEAKAKETDWERSVEEGKKASADEVKQNAETADAATDAHERSLFAKRYAVALYHHLDRVVSNGEQAMNNQFQRELLHSATEECQAALSELVKKQTPTAWLQNNERRHQENQTKLSEVKDDIELCQLYLDDHTKWLQEHNVEDAQKQRQAHRAALEHARYYLSRIESSIFEQEVWNALTPLKKECGIQTLHIEKLADGRQRQTRILYKSDLLFYLKIYTALHTTKNLRNYVMICIDEEQDMHAADYQLIRGIYPNAILNIFGDTQQVLHESCGISDWQRETGVNTLYTLNTNYRTTAAIVEFCNTRFGSNMRYFGAIQEDQRPMVIDNTAQLLEVFKCEVTVVLKDREAFERLCIMAGHISNRFEYVDTKRTDVPEGKIACYSIYAAKGLEFTKVLVFAMGMSKNQKIVACTRAMESLYYFK